MGVPASERGLGLEESDIVKDMSEWDQLEAEHLKYKEVNLSGGVDESDLIATIVQSGMLTDEQTHALKNGRVRLKAGFIRRGNRLVLLEPEGEWRTLLAKKGDVTGELEVGVGHPRGGGLADYEPTGAMEVRFDGGGMGGVEDLVRVENQKGEELN